MSAPGPQLCRPGVDSYVGPMLTVRWSVSTAM